MNDDLSAALNDLFCESDLDIAKYVKRWVRGNPELKARTALRISSAAYGQEGPQNVIHLNNLAGLLQDKGDYAAAEPLFRQALQIDEKTIGVTHPDYATHLNNLAGLLRAKGDYAAVEPLFRQAVQVHEAALGAQHPNSKLARKNLEMFLREKP